MSPTTPTKNDSVISDAELVALFDDGTRAIDIARKVGLTRERVRQRLERNGRVGTNQNRFPKQGALLDAAALSTTWRGLAERLRVTPRTLELALEKHAVRTEVETRLLSNRQAASAEHRLLAQRPYVARIRAIAAEVGHTPTQDELEARDLYHASLHELFGSAQAAMLAAGLTPNLRGRPPMPLPSGFSHDLAPTDDEDVLRRRADQLRRSGLSGPPAGNVHPAKAARMSASYLRDPAVVAWILEIAAGFCELCGNEGYELDDGTRFLEVHHMIALADGGPDVLSNAVGVCETCHGKASSRKG
jgi:5-methylcytosine-specific restriction endonuclease McrA